MGLGNPGPEYENTRHNPGFLLADRLAARWRFPAFRRVPAARETKGNVEGTDVRLIKPQTYMNGAGPPWPRSVRYPASLPPRSC